MLMTFNIQFYSTSKTTGPIANFILSHKPDVVCLQENYPVSYWNTTKSTPLNLQKDYFLASDCQAGYLSNTIYVRNKYFNFTRVLSDVNLTIAKETSRCSAVIQLYDTKIANLHLCGGRFDDKNFEEFLNQKRLQLERLINTHHPDIILGNK
jgi:exonuclease III